MRSDDRWGNLWVRDSIVTDTVAPTGPALYCTSCSDLDLERATISRNSWSYAVWQQPLDEFDSVAIRDSAFLDNTVSGLRVSLSTFLVEDSAFERSGGGGARLTSASAGAPSVTRSTFVDNGSVGLWVSNQDYADITVSDCVFERNVQGLVWGFARNGGDDLLERSTFVDNTASEGAGLEVEGSCDGSIDVADVTFEGNAASIRGGAVFLNFAAFTCSACTFGLNSPDDVAWDACASPDDVGSIDLEGTTDLSCGMSHGC